MRNTLVFFFISLFVLASCINKKQDQSYVKTLEELSLEELDTLAEKYPDSIKILEIYGEKLLEELQGEKALPLLAKAHRLRPKDIHIEQLYASALINRMKRTPSEVETGIEKLLHIVKVDPKNKKAYLDLAIAYNAYNDYENTFKYVNEALRIDPKYRDAYVIKGGTYYQMGNMKLAKSSYETAVQQDAKFFLGYLQLGWIYTETEDYKQALEYFRTAVELDSVSTDALYGVAYSYQMIGESENALEGYRELLEVDSSFYLSYFNQGYIKQYDQQQIDSAVYYYKKSLTLQPEFVKGWHQLGLCYLDNGNKGTALVAFQKALEYNPEYELTLMVMKKYYANYDPTKAK